MQFALILHRHIAAQSCGLNIRDQWIIHVFSCINICRGSRKLFEPEAEGSNCFRETGLGLMLMCSGSKSRPKYRAPLRHTLLYCQGALMPGSAINSRFNFS